jgi:hypothetical protein
MMRVPPEEQYEDFGFENQRIESHRCDPMMNTDVKRRCGQMKES